jgi:hypothetical protein
MYVCRIKEHVTTLSIMQYYTSSCAKITDFLKQTSEQVQQAKTSLSSTSNHTPLHATKQHQTPVPVSKYSENFNFKGATIEDAVEIFLAQERHSD